MISFSISKKSNNSTISKNNESRNNLKNEPVEFITSFTNTNFTEIKPSQTVYNKAVIETNNGFVKDFNPLTLKSRLKSNFTQKKNDIKDYICNDITPITSLDQSDVAKSIYETCSKFKIDDRILEEKLDKFNFNKTSSIMRERKELMKRKNKKIGEIVTSKSKSQRKNPKENDFVVIVLGKFKYEFGKISYVSEEGDILSVEIDTLGRTVKLRPDSVRIISQQQYLGKLDLIN